MKKMTKLDHYVRAVADTVIPKAAIKTFNRPALINEYGDLGTQEYNRVRNTERRFQGELRLGVGQ